MEEEAASNRAAPSLKVPGPIARPIDRRPATLLVISAGLGALALAATPGDAQACGGLFCNSRPPDPFAPLPVAQNGENVVFAIEKDPAGGATTLTAHIQILYTGDAAKFSWVVPVDSAPKLSTGTDLLFTQLARLTQPTFISSYVTEGQCLPPPPSQAYDAGFYPGFGGASATIGSGGAGGASGGVTVSFQGAVGPFDAAVINANDPAELKRWLTDNGYAVSDAASGLIDAYVLEAKHFVALKLLNGVGVRSIQPIVLKFVGTEPCIPLRLTAIAANPDMPVRMWVLGDRRVAPRRYFEIQVDEASIDWLGGGSRYPDLVTRAANEAGGNAFVTEYAGPSSIAARNLWFDGQFPLDRLQPNLTPPVYVQMLLGLGLASDPQMLPLLAKYIPMPDAVKMLGITESMFYGNLASYWTQYAFPPYDLAGLTAAIDMVIVQPRHTAQAMIDAHPYLTRLDTYISPDEMNDDPLFFETRDLGEVSNVHVATVRTMCGNMRFMACNAPVRLELPSGRMTWIRTGVAGRTCSNRPYDLGWMEGLPAMQKGWQRDESGEGVVMFDNTAAIQAALNKNNTLYPSEQRLFPSPVGSGASDPGNAPPGSDTSGCGCRVSDATSGGVGLGTLGAAVAAMLAWGRRRRNRG